MINGSHDRLDLRGGRNAPWQPRRFRYGVLALALAAAIIGSLLVFAQASSSQSGLDCPVGAISAIGPVDEQGQGDTTPDVRCIDP
jgi:hypothetical protein